MKRDIALIALIFATVLLAGCGGSGASLCAQWRQHAVKEEQAAWASAKTWAHRYMAGLPNDSPAEEIKLARTDYAVTIDQDSVRDARNPKWRHAGKCSTPTFRLS